MAAQPTGQFVTNTDAVAGTMTVEQWVAGGYGSEVGYCSSRATQNGEFIGDNKFGQAGLGHDNTNAPGSRSDIVQALHAQEGKGSLK